MLRPEIMRYKKNTSSYMLNFLAIICLVAGFLCVYTNSKITPDFQIGVDILMNIVLLLAIFLAGERVKTYSYMWGVTSIVLGALQPMRILLVPLHYSAKGQLVGFDFALVVVFILGVCVSLLGSGILCLIKNRRLAAYLNSKEA